MKSKKFKKVNNSESVSNNVMENGILIGCHQDLKIKDLKFITKTFDKFLKKYLI
jgi:dTDP-4-amino-4,6-dideoxygalactose transaminase